MTPSKIGILLFCIFISINLVFINYKLFILKPPEPQAVSVTQTTPQSVLIQKQTSESSCTPSCLTSIREATASIALTAPTVSPTRTSASVSKPTPNSVREYFIPLGTGAGSPTEWAEITTVQSWIDSSQYSNIKSVVFETAVQVPDHNQIVQVRLYNLTDKYIVGSSELQFENANIAAVKSSGSIQLGTGNKLYVVQMKTQLGYTTNISNARIRITTN